MFGDYKATVSTLFLVALHFSLILNHNHHQRPFTMVYQFSKFLYIKAYICIWFPSLCSRWETVECVEMTTQTHNCWMVLHKQTESASVNSHVVAQRVWMCLENWRWHFFFVIIIIITIVSVVFVVFMSSIVKSRAKSIYQRYWSVFLCGWMCRLVPWHTHIIHTHTHSSVKCPRKIGTSQNKFY